MPWWYKNYANVCYNLDNRLRNFSQFFSNIILLPLQFKREYSFEFYGFFAVLSTARWPLNFKVHTNYRLSQE